jgi:hypothetical protein
VVYNLDGVDDLVLTREAVAGIFTGSVTSWANPAILSENPNTFLAPDAIVRVVRADKSGTTTGLTRAIYSFANLPQGDALDYSLHPLGGSGLPTWPVPVLPYADGAVCRFRTCINLLCEPGTRLDMAEGACVPCPEVRPAALYSCAAAALSGLSLLSLPHTFDSLPLVAVVCAGTMEECSRGGRVGRWGLSEGRGRAGLFLERARTARDV